MAKIQQPRFEENADYEPWQWELLVKDLLGRWNQVIADFWSPFATMWRRQAEALLAAHPDAADYLGQWLAARARQYESPPRKAKGSSAMHGTIADITRSMAEEALRNDQKILAGALQYVHTFGDPVASIHVGPIPEPRPGKWGVRAKAKQQPAAPPPPIGIHGYGDAIDRPLGQASFGRTPDQLDQPQARPSNELVEFGHRAQKVPASADSRSAKVIIFLSHAAHEREVARILKDAIQDAFPSQADVFVSSDPRSVGAGQKWLPAITASLRDSVLMLVLASPASLARPWVNFEAGAAWMRDIDVIPLCHSGLTPATLPMPLLEFQGLELTSPDDLRVLFGALARHLDCATPDLDVGALAEQLRRAVAAIPQAEATARTGSLLRDRDLSQEREELEAEVHKRILRMQSLRTGGAKPRSPKRFSEVRLQAERFLADPISFRDSSLRELRAGLDDVIAAMTIPSSLAPLPNPVGGVGERVKPSSGDIEQALLKALRQLGRDQADSNVILALDLDGVAKELGITRQQVRDVLVDLLNAGKAEGFAETMTDRKEDGHCRITPHGMASIRD